MKYYARYTDDFVIVADNRFDLSILIPLIKHFLYERLGLSLHPNKVSIGSYCRGVDFLGYVIFPHHVLVRPKTRKRMFVKLTSKFREYEYGAMTKESFDQSLQSYLGVLSHANTYKVSQQIKNQFWIN